MNETSESLINAETTMAQAIEKIEGSILDLEEFKTSTQSLNDIASKNTVILGDLKEVAAILQSGARLLNDEGVKEFNKTLTNTIAEVHQKVVKQISTSGKETSATLGKKINSLLATVLIVGLLNLGLLAYLAFGGN